jgi:aspartate-semialdehyde dehydrogenase
MDATTRLIGAEEAEPGTVTEQGGEPHIMTALDEENLAGSRVVLLAGSPSSSRRSAEIVARTGGGAVLVDMSYAFEEDHNARLRAPMVEPEGYVAEPAAVHVIAHPAAIVLALFLNRLEERFAVRRSVAHVFEPASERGQRGMDELQRQTVHLLTFKTLPKDVYDEQVGFNLLAQYGTEAPEALETFELRIERHLASLLSLSGPAAMPSVRLLQAPVFHGHSFSLWVEFEQNPGPEALEQALATPQIDVRGGDLEAPHIMGIAGQSGMAVGRIRRDPNDPRASWFWLVADNLRITAENGVAVARSVIAGDGAAG